MFVRSTARLANEKIPPTNQYAPRKVIKMMVVMPGHASNVIPRSRARNPHRNTIHQGNSEHCTRMVLEFQLFRVNILVNYTINSSQRYLNAPQN